MRKIFHILPILIVVLFMTALSFIPHHHHEQVACMAVEFCENGNDYDNNHSSHDSSEEESSQSNDCVVKAQYTVGSNVVKDNSLLEGSDNQSIIKSFCLLTSYLIYNFEYSTTQATYNENVAPYESALLGLCSGLRAPPYCLS